MSILPGRSSSNKSILLSGDVEMNPGPLNFTLITINCRGLKREQKFKQLLNRIHSTHSSTRNLIVSLQETHIEFNNLSYTWKGKHIFTPGDGAKGGVITLLSDNIIVKDQVDLGHEAQVALIDVIENNDKNEIVLVNLHSPCPHNQDKIDFFSNIKLEVEKMREKYQVDKILIMGDYNTTFKVDERLGTIRSRLEISCAERISNLFAEYDISDCWTGQNSLMTWRQPIIKKIGIKKLKTYEMK